MRLSDITVVVQGQIVPKLTQKVLSDIRIFLPQVHIILSTWHNSVVSDLEFDELILSQPDSGEQALDIVEMLARSNAIDLIIVDSVAALVPQAEIEGEMGDNQVGLQARLMSKAMRKLAGILNKSSCTIIFINQLREKVGVIYGNPEVTTGGRALKFYASVRIDIRRAEVLKQESDIYGNTVNIKIVKNKVAPPFKSCKVDIIYGEGISRTGEVLDLGCELGLIKKSGSWYEVNGQRMGQGRENAKMFLKDNIEIFNNLVNEIKSIRQKQKEN